MKQSTNKLNQAIERMTTGFKINQAKDNAANYSISTNMATKIGAYNVAEDNAAMGLDLISTAESTLSQIEDKLQRLRALAEQAMNGTYGEQSLRAINEECCALVDEINRVYETTEFNGISLFLEPTEMPDGTVAVVKETDAKLDTTFKDLGITATAFEIYDSDNNLIQAYDLEEEDTIQDFFDTLQTHGFSTELRNGVMNIQSTNLSYIEGDLATALGIQTKEIVDVSYTTETETIWTTTTTETTQTNTIFSTTTSTTTQTSTIYSTTTIENISTIPIEITTTNYVLTTNTLTVPSTIDEVAPLAESGGGFIQEVVRRDTSTMTALSSVDPNSNLADGTYSISTTEELVQLSEMSNSGFFYPDVNYEFVLGSSIDLSSIADWSPINININTYFEFDGNGYVITNLKSTEGGLITDSSKHINTSVINLGIENADIQTSNDYVGIIINEGVINNCYTTGYISGGDYTGGLGGFLQNVQNSYSTATVVGNNYVGGIAGYSRWIKNCYTTATVTGNDYIGGIAGDSQSVENCYTTGSVDGNNYVGGIIGHLEGMGSSYLADCNSGASIEGNKNVGGLCGESVYVEVDSCFFSGEIVGNENVAGLVGLEEVGFSIQNSTVMTASTGLDAVFICTSDETDVWPADIYDSSYNSIYDTLSITLVQGSPTDLTIENVLPIGNSPPAIDVTATADTTFAELGLSDSFQVKSGSGSLLVNVTGAMTLESFINSINSISGYNAELLNGVLLINSLEEVIGLESLNPQKTTNTSTISTTSVQTTTTEQVSTTTATQTITTTSTSSVVETQTLLVTTTSSTTNTTTLWSTSTVATTQTMDKQTYKAIMEDVYAPGKIGLLVGTNANPEQNISVKISFKLDDISSLKGIGLDDYDYLSQIDSLLKKLSEKDVYYGSMQNRMLSVLEEITIQRDNLISSCSTIRDADIAEVSSHYIQQQILQQASATLLATANQSPSIALQLI